MTYEELKNHRRLSAQIVFGGPEWGLGGSVSTAERNRVKNEQIAFGGALEGSVRLNDP